MKVKIDSTDYKMSDDCYFECIVDVEYRFKLHCNDIERRRIIDIFQARKTFDFFGNKSYISEISLTYLYENMSEIFIRIEKEIA